jgi:hypothetical protein
LSPRFLGECALEAREVIELAANSTIDATWELIAECAI